MSQLLILLLAAQALPLLFISGDSQGDAVPIMPAIAASLPSSDFVERQMYDALNAERLRNGLSPVAWSKELASAAAQHSAEMAAHGYLDHIGLDGADQQQRAARQGYVVPRGSGWMVIEAISAMPAMESALGWLLGDGVHRRVLLRSYWREVGIGYAAGGRFGNYWALDFGCRPNVLPVFAEPSEDGRNVSLRFTNENCAASGTGAALMGRATEVMLSTRPDFRDGVWEPFTDFRDIPRPSRRGSLSVRLRDANGRLSAPVSLPLDQLPAVSSPS